MSLLTRPPRPELAPFVELVWHHEGAVCEGLERKIPTGTMQVVVSLTGDQLDWYELDRLDRPAGTTAPAALCGAVSRAVGIDTAPQRRTAGMVLRPGASAALFGVPADELTEPLVGLDDLWGRSGAVLPERLSGAPSPHEVLSHLEHGVLAHAADAEPPDERVRVAVGALTRGWPVHRVVAALDTTPSTLGRLLRRSVGLAPKRFARLQRVQRVLTGVTIMASDGAAREIDWAAVAVENGYYDQSHLVNEFRSITGTTPGTYRPRSRGERNHVPI